MKQFTVAAVNGGMIGHRCAKAAQQDIARLCRGQGHPVKACDRHIVRKGSDRCATSHPHAQNPAYQFPPDGMHPGTACNSPSPRAQSAVLSDVAHSGIYECPPADQPPGQCTFYLQPPVGLAQPGQTTGMTVDQCHNLPCISARSQSSGAIRKYASGSAEIFTHGRYRSPSGVLTTKPHDSAGTHRRVCARITDSVCVIGFTAKVC